MSVDMSFDVDWKDKGHLLSFETNAFPKRYHSYSETYLFDDFKRKVDTLCAHFFSQVIKAYGMLERVESNKEEIEGNPRLRSLMNLLTNTEERRFKGMRILPISGGVDYTDRDLIGLNILVANTEALAKGFRSLRQVKHGKPEDLLTREGAELMLTVSRLCPSASVLMFGKSSPVVQSLKTLDRKAAERFKEIFSGLYIPEGVIGPNVFEILKSFDGWDSMSFSSLGALAVRDF
jgi:hypothetical protein